MATEKHTSATALPQQLSPAQVEEINDLHYQYTMLSSGLQGIGTAVGQAATESAMRQLANAVYSLGEYSMFLTCRLETLADDVTDTRDLLRRQKLAQEQA